MTKHYIYAFLAFILGGFLIAVGGSLASSYIASKTSDKTGATEKVAPAPKPRIVLKNHLDYIEIYEIDSVEYIINHMGGIYPLIKKQNDKQP